MCSFFLNLSLILSRPSALKFASSQLTLVTSINISVNSQAPLAVKNSWLKLYLRLKVPCFLKKLSHNAGEAKYLCFMEKYVVQLSK